MNVKKTRNAGTWTESRYFSQIRSHLRKAFMYWKPIQQCKIDGRRKSQSDNKRLKWEYKCNICNEWLPEKYIQVDHIEACGSLKCYEDIVPFTKRLTTEHGFRVLCKVCHLKVTLEAKK